MSGVDLETIRARLREVDPRSEPSPRAAVAAVLREHAGRPEVLFIQRAEHPDDPWSGHMAFPGGRLDPSDDTLERTAVRETHEELGLDLRAHGQLVGRLDDVPTHKTGLVVRPFVWTLERLPELRPNHEVAEVCWVDLPSLMSGERDTGYDLDWKGSRHRFPGYSVGDRVVWGLTYRMLQIFFEALRR